MKKINVIIRATEECNLRCKYCYNSGTEYARGALSLERLSKLLALLCAEYDAIDITWHGGEPMMCGIDYFERAMAIENELFRKTDVEINNSIQTNGTLINGKWIKFFKKYRFGIGISFDGIDNGAFRGGTEKVLGAFELLKKADAHFGCMAVVQSDDYDLMSNYKFFAERGIPLAFSPLIAEGAGVGFTPLTSENYVKKSCELFDYWLKDTRGVNVRLFSAYLGTALGSTARICTNASCLGKWLGVAPDGNVYNCARAGVAAYPFGNIDDAESASDLFKSAGFIALLKGSIARRKKCADGCEYFDYCAGGCADNALAESGLENPPEFSCACFKGIFSHIRKRAEELKADPAPLDTLNPAVRATVVRCLAEGGGE